MLKEYDFRADMDEVFEQDIERIVRRCMAEGVVCLTATEAEVPLRAFVRFKAAFIGGTVEVYVNPSYQATGNAERITFPEMWIKDDQAFNKARWDAVEAVYDDYQGIRRNQTLYGIDAIIFQHCTDILNGEDFATDDPFLEIV